MSDLLTAAAMREIEQSAMAAGVVTGLELMERAGAGVVQAMRARWPRARRAHVLCGPGNNGGDGYVIARLLWDCGWHVLVYVLGDPAHLPPDARSNFTRWRAIGDIAQIEDVYNAPQADILVDALFGTGLVRPLSEDLLAALAFSATACDQIVAVDIPSGVNTDTGKLMPDALRADLTVTFHKAKRGHKMGQGPRHCGALVVHDIGL